MKSRPSAKGYAFWAGLGALVGMGFVSILTIGIWLLVIAGAMFAYGLSRPALLTRSASGAVAGLAVPALLIAWLNRHGPGTYCEYLDGGGQRCTEMWSPWPFVAAAVLFVLTTVTVVRLTGPTTRPGRGVRLPEVGRP